jgi:RNA polymerase sigma factor FliA
MPSSIASAAREREQSILNQMPQVKLLAARLYRRCPANVLLEDLVSAGVTGLIEATDRYDPRRKVKLKTLAEHRIRGAMLDYLRKLDPLPRAVTSFIRDRESATGELEQRLYRAPSDDEVAAFLSIPIERYRRLSRIAQSGEMLHLDQRGEAFRSAREIPASDDWTPYTIALIRALDLAVESLPERERTVIFFCFVPVTCPARSHNGSKSHRRSYHKSSEVRLLGCESHSGCRPPIVRKPGFANLWRRSVHYDQKARPQFALPATRHVAFEARHHANRRAGQDCYRRRVS